MRIARLSIRNFRGVREADVCFASNSVIVAPNNAGKTAIVEALALLFGRGRLYRDLFEYDFFGADPKPEDRIKLSAVVTDFPSDDPDQNPGFFNLERGATPVWWDHVSQEVHPEPKETASLGLEIGYHARFDVEEMDSEAIRFFVDGDTDPFLEGSAAVRVPNSIIEAIGVFVIPAHRDWGMLTSFRSRTFEQVVAATKAFPGVGIRKIRDELRNPQHRLEQEREFSELVDRFDSELAFFVGDDAAGLTFRPTAGDTPSVLEALHPHLRARGGAEIPIRHHGSGVRSLQTLLLLLEFGRLRSARDENFILVAEEPELHLHPGHHRRLVGRMRAVCSQTILTTHSPEVAAFHGAAEILVANPSGDGVLSAEALRRPEEEIPETNALMKLFTVRRQALCEALMSPVAVVPEGDLDTSWIHHLARVGLTSEGWELVDPDRRPGTIGVVPTIDAHVVRTFQVLERVHGALVPLVDGDPAGSEYIKALARLPAPPPTVCQLLTGWTIEDVIAWIIGEGPSPEIEEIVTDWDGSREQLAEKLKSPEFKTHRGRHEQLAAALTGSSERVERINEFLLGIWAIGRRSAPPGSWRREESAGSDLKVWRFKPGDR